MKYFWSVPKNDNVILTEILHFFVLPTTKSIRLNGEVNKMLIKYNLYLPGFGLPGTGPDGSCIIFKLSSGEKGLEVYKCFCGTST